VADRGRVLITGIAGQDGSYLAERLIGEGREVHGLVPAHDLAAARTAPALAGCVLHAADLADPAAVADVVAAAVPDELYHLGGISSVDESWRDPIRVVTVNGVGTAALLEAVRTTSPYVHAVVASSAEIFAGSGTSPQDERTPVAPRSPYGAAKALVHHLTGAYRERGLFVSSCVLYNHESPRRPDAFVTRRITQGVAAIAAGAERRLTLGNLDSRRDWGWAPDYVDAMVRAARHDVATDFVIGTGEAHTVAEFAAAAFRYAGIPDWKDHIRSDASLARPYDAAELRANAGKARAELGWAPTVAFEAIVAAMTESDMRR